VRRKILRDRQLRDTRAGRKKLGSPGQKQYQLIDVTYTHLSIRQDLLRFEILD
jgi:hypothetical protein